MKKNKILVIGILILSLITFLAAANWYKSRQTAKQEKAAFGNKEPLVRSHSPRLGPETAPVTIVEFFDPECEACRAVYPMVKQLLKEYEGKVQLVMRYMTFHKNSAYAAGLLEAARKQGKYWEALETLFIRQPEWASHQAPKPQLILVYMKDLGLDVESLEASANDAEIKSRLLQDQEDGNLVGVTGTPTFFVNGKLLPRLGYEQLRAAIEAEL